MFKFAIVLICCLSAALASPARIIGGQTARLGQFPHQVAILFEGYPLCSGAIIDKETVITTATCAVGFEDYEMQVVVGTVDILGGTSYDVQSVTIHEDFDLNALKNDIAIVKVQKPIVFGKYVQAIAMRTTRVTDGEEITFSGWGNTYISMELQFLETRTVSNEECNAAHSGYEVYDNEICTATTFEQGACMGDSGAPLVDKQGKFVGVLSWGAICAKGKPDVSTRISDFVDWINKNK